MGGLGKSVRFTRSVNITKSCANKAKSIQPNQSSVNVQYCEGFSPYISETKFIDRPYHQHYRIRRKQTKAASLTNQIDQNTIADKICVRFVMEQDQDLKSRFFTWVCESFSTLLWNTFHGCIFALEKNNVFVRRFKYCNS